MIFLAFLGQKLKKWAVHKSAFFSILPIFRTKSKSIENTKKLFPQMIKGCWIKFPPFKIEKGFLAIFFILPKSRKWPKIHFLFWKVEIFLAHLNHLGRQFFCIFYTFLFNKKMGKIKKNSLLCTAVRKSVFFQFCPFFWSNQKV